MPRSKLHKVSEISEKAFQAQIIQLAKLYGWLVFHDFDSRRNAPGFPDLVLCNNKLNTTPARTIFAELKTEHGRVSKEQAIWLETLRTSGCDVRLWRPSQLESEIIPTLQGMI